MCLAIPGKIRSITDETAQVDYGGVCKTASLRFFPRARLGDRVLVHAGFVIQILDEDAGDELMELLGETDFADESRP